MVLVVLPQGDGNLGAKMEEEMAKKSIRIIVAGCLLFLPVVFLWFIRLRDMFYEIKNAPPAPELSYWIEGFLVLLLLSFIFTILAIGVFNLSRAAGYFLVSVGALLTAYAAHCLINETISPTADRFGLVFVIFFGPLGLILLIPGIIIFTELRKQKLHADNSI